MKDENAIVLDFLEHGRPGGPSEPVAQVIGTENFNLLEVVPREDVRLSAGDDVYIGDGDRDKVRYIKGKVTTQELTETAKSELEYVLEELVEENEDQFVEFFNDAQPITPRQHALELLPSIGEKHMWEILDERDEGDFESLDDMRERVELLPDPKKILVKRLTNELSGDTKHYLFTVPPKSEER
ncbi:MAG: DUF655 domain-containing protein [Candidatus Nanohaloarchaeota archaeon QJJ-7]|nr:DUF655 domain-containing protein [Candidatus Nanohaloarchaeota archaeon QJJ-7]